MSKAPLPHPKLMVWFHQTKNVSIPSAADSLARETLNRIFHNFYYFLSVGSYRLPVSQSPLYHGPVLLYKLLFFCISLSIFFNFPNIFAFEGLEKCQHTPFFVCTLDCSPVENSCTPFFFSTCSLFSLLGYGYTFSLIFKFKFSCSSLWLIRANLLAS